MSNRHYEDFTVGESHDLDSVTVSESDIIAFAKRYDPQEFHTDPDVAAETSFGQIFASGWHTAALCMRQLVEGLFSETAIVGGVGVDELRWTAPVYADDTLAVTATVTEKSDWDESRGVVTLSIEAVNQRNETVIKFDDLALIERSEAV